MHHFLMCALLAVASTFAHAQAPESLLDFSLVMPPAPDRQMLARPAVSWEVRADAATHCASVSDHDGYGVWREGCVYWRKSMSSCTIVTTGRTSHSLMGRLFMLCLQAGESS